MKKFLTAAVASILIFGGQVDVEAATVDLSEPPVQIQEMSAWPRIRDSLLGRRHHHDRDRHHRDWERHHHYNDRHRYRPPHRHGAPPPPPRW